MIEPRDFPFRPPNVGLRPELEGDGHEPDSPLQQVRTQLHSVHHRVDGREKGKKTGRLIQLLFTFNLTPYACIYGQL